MDIEAIVKKYKEDAPLCSYDFDQSDAETMLSAALTELAAGYEQKQALLLDAHCERVNLLQERIHQFEAERDGMALVPRELLDKFPELNTSNYGHDDVDELNAWGIELVLAAAPQQPKKEVE